jgi:hypothetical protein
MTGEISVVLAARRLAETQPGHHVVSVYLDLDPERFATPSARASQIGSLLDQAHRTVEHDVSVDHDEKLALRQDLDRIRQYLHSREPPYKGARALALFCSLRDDLFEVVQLRQSLPGKVVIERIPYVEPLLRRVQERTWCVALVSRRSARILSGAPDGLEQRDRVDDDVPGQHDQGGWSQANYQRSVQKETDDHLRRVAELLYRRWHRERFDRLALGGPIEIVPRLQTMLHEDLRSTLTDRRVDLDVATANEDQVRAAVAALVEYDEQQRERDALDQMAAGIATGGRGTGGAEATLEALNERRVHVLLLDSGFDRPGSRCSRCGLLSPETNGPCPADGTALTEVAHLREAVVESALAQDAEIVVVSRFPDLGPFGGIGAVLRF